MSEKPISPLRQRMLEDMSVRRFVPDTRRGCGRLCFRVRPPSFTCGSARFLPHLFE
jgi:hypothetical protein